MEKILIGPIQERTMPRPGGHQAKAKHAVPEPTHAEFWDYVSEYMLSHGDFYPPIREPFKTNPYFGRFGLRYHPIDQIPGSFHLGVDLTAPMNTPVYPLTQGILEYSGFSLQNGNYVLLSHPHITTEDGFVLYTLYVHLHNCKVRFTGYQKMLREMSLRTHPRIPINPDTIIGTVGDSGDESGKHAHLHVQCEFRHPDGTIIAFDPALLLGIDPTENLSAHFCDDCEFAELPQAERDAIIEYGIENYWKKD